MDRDISVSPQLLSNEDSLRSTLCRVAIGDCLTHSNRKYMSMKVLWDATTLTT
jgi:hypothetical protein